VIGGIDGVVVTALMGPLGSLAIRRSINNVS
jgi:hypothetical protein